MQLCSQDTHVNTCNLFCSGPGKRKFSGRKGWWCTRTAMPRRPWRSTGLARERYKQCRKLAKDNELNDKFKVEQLHWAKEGHVAGGAVSWIQELASSRVEQDRATSGEKPGGSVDSAKDNPGKHSNIHCSNTFLAGCYDVDKDHADGQGVQDPGAVQGDPDQVHGGGEGIQQHDEPMLYRRGNRLGQEGGGDQEQQQSGGGDEVGQSAWARDGGVHLRYPEEGVLPGFAKSRRKRKPDGLVQMQINASLFFLKQIVPSVGIDSVPSGEPCGANERERGSKRGMDQVEGPVAKKRLREN